MSSQKAGLCRVTAETGGWPTSVTIALESVNGQKHEARVAVADLHDLRYCIDRVLSQLPPDRQ